MSHDNNNDNAIALIIDKHPSGEGAITIHVDDGEYGTSGDYSVAASIGVVTLYQMADENAMSLPDAVKFDGVVYKNLNQLAIAVRQRVRDLGGDVYWDADNPILTLMEPIKHPKDLVPKQSEQGVVIKLEIGVNQHNGKLWITASADGAHVSENELTISDAIGAVIAMMLMEGFTPTIEGIEFEGEVYLPDEIRRELTTAIQQAVLLLGKAPYWDNDPCSVLFSYVNPQPTSTNQPAQNGQPTDITIKLEVDPGTGHVRASTALGVACAHSWEGESMDEAVGGLIRNLGWGGIVPTIRGFELNGTTYSITEMEAFEAAFRKCIPTDDALQFAQNVFTQGYVPPQE